MTRNLSTKWLAMSVVGFAAAAMWAENAGMAQQDVLIPGGPIEYNVQPLELFAVPGGGDVLFTAADDTLQSEYWLGLQLAALPEVVKRQLAVEDGLTVEEVAEDSPAAKAAIKKFDILVKADDTPLKSLSDLVKAVDASQGKEIVITIVRGGKDSTVKVAAIKRPEGERFTLRAPQPEFRAEIRRLEEALEGLKAKAGKDGAGFWFAKPGFVAPRVDVKIPEMKLSDKIPEIVMKAWKTEFPKNLSVQINKEGDQPAKIHVKQGDKEWDVTEDKLNELPEDVRQHVQRLRGQAQMPGPAKVAVSGSRAIRVTPEGKVEGELKITPMPPKPPVPPAASTRARPPAAPMAPAAPLAARIYSYRTERGEDGADSKLDDILKEVKQLRKEVDELRSKSPGDARK
ncbi:MAG TPA: PDZ domain-containing protein [Pirellulaceae bacterium]|nr:PDZ domain-containing protein [Pirellulaceae bacterium]